MIQFFTEPAAWVPTGGVLFFIYLCFAGGAPFWGWLAVIAAVLLFLGNL